ncbi:Sarcosine oxidase [Rhodovastum atsumiense]|uniref:Sarcosine oxidase n=1 Tax=Rhodovastum atsumiense TaxID=504468 RepID=A0A5M6IXZ9_9PROT|nr:sarcosine oxidase [Rhodovastum atsumiense]KAA5612839.1 sarcosine oxidase [Rhodovastum atsumiense]CAH2601096.1 Sarcosine oxidase [Rhodovastum atsumiense]
MSDTVLRDFSDRPRIGFKGADTSRWLSQQGLRFGDASNRAYPQPDGSLLVRLSPGEFLLLEAGDTGAVVRLQAAWSWEAEAGLCFPVPRRDSHAWFHLEGARVPEVFATLCGVDLRLHRFADHSVAQTSVARLNAIVIRDGDGFHLLADSASAEYLQACLSDALAA